MQRIKVDIKIRMVLFTFNDVLLHVYGDGRVYRPDMDCWISDNIPTKKGYIKAMIGKSYVKLHRIVYSALVEDVMDRPDIKIDHRRTKSNDISNLRRATYAENNHNREAGKNSKTGIKNIYARKIGNSWGWCILIRSQGMKDFTRFFTIGPLPIPSPLPPVPQDIIDICEEAKRQMHGAFAR